ncbi:MAG: dTDP-4-amino-4,6-dideoxygalactose transaminase [Actinomycetes bacterium]
MSTANAFALRGARPVFVDVDPVTLNIDPAAIAAAVGPRTRAVVVVHYAGVACAMDEIASLTTANDLALIEDAAHGCGGSYAGRPLGSIGDFGTLSFHDTKNVQCGEGGALLVNRAEALPRAEVLREKGTNRRAFLRGDVDRYSWVDVGSSYLLGELPAAALLAQLEAADAVIGRRRTIWERYRVELSDWAQRHGVQLPAPPPYAEHAAQLFHLLLPTASARDEFLEHLRERDVGAAFHFVPLHLSPLARAFGHNAPLPVTESAAERLARLPLYPDLTDAQVGHVIDAVTSFRPAA